MRAELAIGLGRGRADARLAFTSGRRDPVRVNPWILVAALALTLPFAVGLTAAAVTSAAHTKAGSVPTWLYGAGTPGAGRLLALGPPLALLLLALSRIRLHAAREAGRWVGRVTARLSAWELAVGLVALAVAALFFGHLLADSFACANGLRTAC